MLDRTSFLFALMVFLLSLLLYGWTIYPVLGGSLDSPELQICAKMLGISHPTGYPFYMLFAHLLTWIPFGSVAVKSTFISALSMALTCALLYLSAVRVCRDTRAAFLVVLAFMVCDNVWSVATVTEVYAFQMLLTSSILLLFILYINQPRRPFSYALAFLAGLGMVHHLMTLMILLGMGLTLVIKRQRPSFMGIQKHALFFAIPLLLYAYLPLRNMQEAHSFDLYTFHNFTDYIAFILGGENTGLLRLDVAWFLREGFLQGMRYFLEHYGFILTFFAGLGLYEMMRQRRTECVLLVWLTLIHIALAGVWTEADREAIILPALIAASLLSTVGIAKILKLFFEWNRRGRKLFVPASIILIVLLLLHSAYYSYECIRERNEVKQYACDELIYQKIPPHSIVLTMYWERVNAWKYLIHSGEYPHKNIHVYRWNDPRAKAGIEEIIDYMKGEGTIGQEALEPDPKKAFFMLEPWEDLDLPEEVKLIPFEMTPEEKIYSFQLDL